MGGVKDAAHVGVPTISPGDLIMGDDNRLSALTPEMASGLIVAAEAKLVLEANGQQSLGSGKILQKSLAWGDDRRQKRVGTIADKPDTGQKACGFTAQGQLEQVAAGI